MRVCAFECVCERQRERERVRERERETEREIERVVCVAVHALVQVHEEIDACLIVLVSVSQTRHV